MYIYIKLYLIGYVLKSDIVEEYSFNSIPRKQYVVYY